MNWKKMNLSQKIASVVACLGAVIWLLSTVRADLFPVDLTYPGIAVFTVGEAVVYWKEQRKWAVVMIVGAVVSLAFFFMELLLLK